MQLSQLQLPRFVSFIRQVGLSGWRPAAPAPGDDEATEFVPDADDILLDATYAGRSELFARIGRHAEYSYDVDRDQVTRALEQRERAGSTALGLGVAIPQARVQGLGRARALYVRLKTAIEFDAPDGRPVRDVFVLLLPGAVTQRHIDMQVRVAHMFADPAFRERLHRCAGAGEARALFEAELAALA